MQRINQSLRRTFAATLSLVMILAFTLSIAQLANAQTTGPGDHALVNIAIDHNYNCVRDEKGTCLPEMPGTGGGGANGQNHDGQNSTLARLLNDQYTPSSDIAGYIDSDHNWIFVAIIGVSLAGLVILIWQFRRLGPSHTRH